MFADDPMVRCEAQWTKVGEVEGWADHQCLT